jgi:hypothetical protein
MSQDGFCGTTGCGIISWMADFPVYKGVMDYGKK